MTRTFDNVELAEGNNVIQIVATLEGDETTENNTNSTTVNRSIVVSDFQFVEDFETEPYGWTPSAANAWTVVEAEGGNHYFKTDTAVSTSSYIYGPCFDFSSLEMPELHFDVMADYPTVSDMGGLGGLFGGMGDMFGGITKHGYVLISKNNGTSWDTITIDASATWVNKNIDLSAYHNEPNIQIRIAYNAGLGGLDLGGFLGGETTTTGGAGISIDNIIIKDAAENDLGVTAITGPASGCGLSGNTHVSVAIKNYGRLAQSNYIVKYSIDGGENWTEETVSTQITNGQTTNYTFNATLNITGTGRYDIIAKTALEGDEDSSNDEAEGFVVSQGSYDHAEALFDRENFVNDWYADGTNSSWAFGKTAVSQNDSIWTWATNPNGPANSGEESYLYTPCYDLSGMENPIIKIYLMYNLSSMDMGDVDDETGEMPIDPSSMFGMFGGSLSLWYSLNGGSSWIEVVPADGDLNSGWYTSNSMTEEMSDPGWSGNSNGFVTVKTRLNFASTANLTNVKFRFAFKTSSMNTGDSELGFDIGDLFGGMTGSGSIKGAAINNFIIYDCSPTPIASFTHSGELCTGRPIQFTNNSQNAESYEWSFGDGTGLDLSQLTGDEGFDLSAFFGSDGSTTSTEENPTMTYTADGEYTVILTATNQCGTSIHQEVLAVNSCSDIEEVENGISIYPNPANSNLTIVNAENANIEIVNALGQVVYASENISGEHTIDISNLSNGTYFVKVNNTVTKVNIVR